MKLRNKKTGEVVVCGEGIIEFKTFGCKNLAEFLEAGWEDYKPTEPLIKDEKVRKAVRAWADGNNIESVHYDAFWRGFRRDNSSITVWEELPLEDNEVYTVAELCGEEEE